MVSLVSVASAATFPDTLVPPRFLSAHATARHSRAVGVWRRCGAEVKGGKVRRGSGGEITGGKGSKQGTRMRQVAAGGVMGDVAKDVQER